MPRLAFVIFWTSVVIGSDACHIHKNNDQSCDRSENFGKGMCPDAPIIGGPCHDDNDCNLPNLRFCDTTPNHGTCVQCIRREQCGGTTPLCTNDQCAPCAAHTDCPESNVCLPDGSCAQSDNVAYVDGNGGQDNTLCTKTNPCTHIEKAVDVKSIVKVTGTVTARCMLNNKTATILADPGAKLLPSDDGPALDIKGNSRVQVYDFEIAQASGGPSKNASGIAVSDTADVQMTRVTSFNNSMDGAHVTGGHFTCVRCTLASNAVVGVSTLGGMTTISQSTIKDNAQGGIFVNMDGVFQIVGNVIFHNGLTNTLSGGINAQVNGSPLNRIDFNSISHNSATNAIGQGIHCISGMPLTISNNIIWNNGISLPQVNAGGCTYAFSDVGPTGIGTTMSNMNTDPEFMDESNGNLHLKSTSPVIRKADMNADLMGFAAKDIDDQPRMAPADLGADQLPR